MDEKDGGEYRGAEMTGPQSPAQDYVEHVLDMADILDLRRPGMYDAKGRQITQLEISASS